MRIKIYFIILLAGSLFFGCDNKEKEEAYQSRISQLKAREQELQRQVQEKEAAFGSFMASITDIEKKLREIRAREMNIEMTQQEEALSPEDLRTRISEDLDMIEKLIAENKQSMKNMDNRIRRFHQENGELTTSMTTMSEDLNAQIEEREQSLTMLKDQLNDMQATVKALHVDVDSLSRLNDEKTTMLNTAYYVVGNYKELKDEQILDKEGGFLGFLGSVKMLRNDFNRNKFTRIDLREKLSFPTAAKKIELVSIHPSDSYKIEKEASGDNMNLVVSDPEKFWESSKYLVMMTK